MNKQCTKCGSRKTCSAGLPFIGCGGCLCILIPPLGIAIFILAVLESIFKATRNYRCMDCKRVFISSKSKDGSF